MAAIAIPLYSRPSGLCLLSQLQLQNLGIWLHFSGLPLSTWEGRTHISPVPYFVCLVGHTLLPHAEAILPFQLIEAALVFLLPEATGQILITP